MHTESGQGVIAYLAPTLRLFTHGPGNALTMDIVTSVVLVMVCVVLVMICVCNDGTCCINDDVLSY